MRKFTAALLFCLATTSAFAATASEPDYSGEYRLTDGRVLTIGEENGRMTAQIARPLLTQPNERILPARKRVLVQVGPASFKSTSSSLLISFAQGAGSDGALVSVNEQPPVQALAGR
jgi:hypothetical protein